MPSVVEFIKQKQTTTRGYEHYNVFLELFRMLGRSGEWTAISMPHKNCLLFVKRILFEPKISELWSKVNGFYFM